MTEEEKPPVGINRLKVPITLMMGGVISYVSFDLLRNALRWPARIIVCAGLIGLIWMAVHVARKRWKRQSVPIMLPATALFAVAVILFVESVLDRDPWRSDFFNILPVPSSRLAVNNLLSLNEELERRGIELTVVAMPYRKHLSSKAEDSAFKDRLQVSVARKGMTRLSLAGVECVDLWDIFEEKGDAVDFWDPDNFHLTVESQTAVAAEIAAKLKQDPRFQDNEHSLLMGECFARQFGSNLRRHHEDWADLKILFLNGDRGKVANLLFIFPDQYLKGTTRIYWLMSYQTLATDVIPVIEPNPSHDSEEIKVNIELKDGLAWTKKTHAKKIKEMPYENGLMELLGETSDGRKFVLIGYGITDRTLTALGVLKKGNRITTTIVPYEAHIRQFPEVASEYVVHPTDDFEAPRMWIKEWVRDY